MNGDRYFDGDAFPEDFFPGGMDGDEEQGGYDEQDEFEKTFQLEEKEINQRILFQTIKYLRRSITGWQHLGLLNQRKLIKEQYNFYQALLAGFEVEDTEDMEDLDAENEKE